MNYKSIVLFFIIVMLLSGYGCCMMGGCLRDVRLEPPINTVDATKKSVDMAGVPTTIHLNCCMGSDELGMLKSLEAKLVEDVDKVRNGQMTVDQYNKNQRAIAEAIEQINEKCNDLSKTISDTNAMMKSQLP